MQKKRDPCCLTAIYGFNKSLFIKIMVFVFKAVLEGDLVNHERDVLLCGETADIGRR